MFQKGGYSLIPFLGKLKWNGHRTEKQMVWLGCGGSLSRAGPRDFNSMNIMWPAGDVHQWQGDVEVKELEISVQDEQGFNAKKWGMGKLKSVSFTGWTGTFSSSSLLSLARSWPAGDLLPSVTASLLLFFRLPFPIISLSWHTHLHRYFNIH